jgi:hypothetical protein
MVLRRSLVQVASVVSRFSQSTVDDGCTQVVCFCFGGKYSVLVRGL